MTAEVRRDLEAAARIAQAWLDARGPGTAIDETTPIQLRDWLYAQWYAAPRDVKDLATWAVPFVAHLRAADAGSRRWQSGWIAGQVSTAGRVIAVKGAERRLLWPGDYALASGAARPVQPADALVIVDRLDTIDQLPGYWTTCSADWFPLPVRIVRVYWNTTPRGAASIVRRITEVAAGLPFSLKVPTDPAHFNRPDAVVLYLHAPLTSETLTALEAAASAERAWLATSTPPLTRMIGDGVALAIAPSASGESFGQHRCRLIAEAAIHRRTNASTETDDASAAIARRFARDGIDPASPWQS